MAQRKVSTRCMGQTMEFFVDRSVFAGTLTGWKECRDFLLAAASLTPDLEKGFRTTCVDLAGFAELRFREFTAMVESRQAKLPFAGREKNALKLAVACPAGSASSTVSDKSSGVVSPG